MAKITRPLTNTEVKQAKVINTFVIIINID